MIIQGRRDIEKCLLDIYIVMLIFDIMTVYSLKILFSLTWFWGKFRKSTYHQFKISNLELQKLFIEIQLYLKDKYRQVSCQNKQDRKLFSLKPPAKAISKLQGYKFTGL